MYRETAYRQRTRVHEERVLRENIQGGTCTRGTCTEGGRIQGGRVNGIHGHREKVYGGEHAYRRYSHSRHDFLTMTGKTGCTCV